MRYGYCRTSKPKQSIERQIRNIKAAFPDAVIVQEVFTIVVTKKSIESKEVIRKLSKEFNGNLSDAEIMRLTGLSRNTYYKYKRELKEENRI